MLRTSALRAVFMSRARALRRTASLHLPQAALLIFSCLSEPRNPGYWLSLTGAGRCSHVTPRRRWSTAWIPTCQGMTNPKLNVDHNQRQDQ